MNKVANYKLRGLYVAKIAICSPPNDASGCARMSFTSLLEASIKVKVLNVFGMGSFYSFECPLSRRAELCLYI